MPLLNGVLHRVARKRLLRNKLLRPKKLVWRGKWSGMGRCPGKNLVAGDTDLSSALSHCREKLKA